MIRQSWTVALAVTLVLAALQPTTTLPAAAQGVEDVPFTFAVSADMRQFSGPGTYDTPNYFRGVCEAIAALGENAFMISPGDIDPPENVKWTIEQTLGADYLWYPGAGNHETETPADMTWLRDYNAGGDTLPNIVNIGPPGCEETTYSFDYGNAHFVMLNLYFDGVSDTGSDGDVVDALYDWLAADLVTTGKKYIFVFGHEGAYPQPDEHSGRARHVGISLDQYPVNRDRFWTLLRDEGVTAYFYGHTHGYSAVKIEGVWQVDAGHARGAGDSGAPSTFIMVYVEEGSVAIATYRALHDGSYEYDDIVLGTMLEVSAWPEETLHFQDGLLPDAGYAGTRDTTIKSDDPDTNFGSGDNLEVDGDPGYASMIKWRIDSIPPGKRVTYASVTLNITDNCGGVGYELYEMKRDWVENEANWTAWAGGSNWQTVGADGPDDRGDIVLGKIATNLEGRFAFNLNDDGIALVQSWIDDPSMNRGLVVLDYGNTDGLDFDSREDGSIDSRPKLTVEVTDGAQVCFIGTVL